MDIITLDQQLEIANYINAYRSIHQSPPLIWDNTIAAFSQEWSTYLAKNNIFQHSGNTQYGENLSYFQGYPLDVITLLKKAVDGWYNEVAQYDFTNPGFSEATGHFTCLVWLSSASFGMGFTYNPDTRVAMISFNTYPAGNVMGYFAQNVLPAIVLPPVEPVLPPVEPVLPPVEPVLPPVEPVQSVQKIQILNQIDNIINILRSPSRDNRVIYLVSNLIESIQTNIPSQYIGGIIDILNYIIIMLQYYQNQYQMIQFLATVRDAIDTISF